MEFNHIPVLLKETIEGLNIRPDGIYIDGTGGGGGHSEALLKQLTTGMLISIDQDPDAIAAMTGRLSGYPGSRIVQRNFSDMAEIVSEMDIETVDGVLLDIGVSSHQFDEASRGFSVHNDAPLDMRMSKSGTTAADLVNSLSWQKLAEIFSKYGEEKSSKRIALAIEKTRQERPIETTLQLADVVRESVPAAVRREKGHPARKVFQALRIFLNGELDHLSRGMDAAFSVLKPQGRLCCISFHSLEDRIIKQRMAEWCKGCTCPPDFPVCVCGKEPRATLITRKPVQAGEEEQSENPRSRSAKLRVCEKR